MSYSTNPDHQATNPDIFYRRISQQNPDYRATNPEIFYMRISLQNRNLIGKY